MKTVYIETTIPSYYFETRKSHQALAWRAITRQWWDAERADYRLVTSQVVLDELRRAPSAKARSAELLISSIHLLDPVAGIEQAANEYMKQKLMPSSAIADALHVAFAAVHEIDVVLTWNCRHLANLNKAMHLAVINKRLGLSTPTIVTPLALMSEGPQ